MTRVYRSYNHSTSLIKVDVPMQRAGLLDNYWQRRGKAIPIRRKKYWKTIRSKTFIWEHTKGVVARLTHQRVNYINRLHNI